ncbi:DUF2780 domain-containing protein [Pseudomonas synxantha]|uniref:DUF2780 domain-containing protein n=2 Tax=Pseudomonas fluorescens group TaxID=136843 RepID=A0ABR5MCH1_9PSED|nr:MULTISPECIES: DUF2780 domain-containing protein [Pseudomonas]AKA83072.1 hypothetical protein VO64_2526 [Pseudomonas synxantha]KPG77042.1 hypothetical protein AEQ48_01570 [Pseudomonas libanensis]KRA13395.1 hypothetical protein ASD70_05575 [Pseudomonas sp. Root569]MDT3229379.1 DUF2780 domain-containing protein [Pseudomonas sp. rhizo25]WDG42115.1 DUF2780 domain-containing protein [Pseudomonas synxantha]
MKISRGFALSCVMTLAAGPVFAAGFSLGDAANAISGMQGGNNKAAAAAPSSETAGLLSALTSQLNITPEQAVGGTGAMLGLAKNKLSGNDYSQLGNSVPGLDQLSGNNALGSLGALSGLLGQKGGSKTSGLDGLLGDVKNTNDLNTAFSALGMDSGMVSQFAPVILQYLGGQGASNSVLSKLAQAWGTGS